MGLLRVVRGPRLKSNACTYTLNTFDRLCIDSTYLSRSTHTHSHALTLSRCYNLTFSYHIYI